MSDQGKCKGWIHLHRKIQDCFLWIDKEPFDHRSAWIDLLLLANHEDKKTMFNGSPITVKRGEMLTSILALSERWHWSRHKTSNFLNVLEQEGMILQKRDNKRTLVTIVNYDVYQHFDDEEGHQKDNSGTSEGHQKDTNKNEKNEKNEKNLKDSKKSKDFFVALGGEEGVLSMWNSLTDCGITAIRSVDGKRRSGLNARLNEHGVDSFAEVVKNIRNSKFLRGYGKQQFVATFDWVIKPNNYPKVLEGNYTDADKKTVPAKQIRTTKPEEYTQDEYSAEAQVRWLEDMKAEAMKDGDV